ncbi:T9SS type A sorting domain-containing protein [Spirosoma taeanense]|uniref:T9SS type A sorting domain-containing protein n=1 Tax=Spirosoma taeanense TaxID=2735870 RepID=A0A6M5Y9I7_9BACT|nr:T9SS type A sorting domain-containing protein [Spirosoma taeanense]QJW90154.1 T9SS type A sorting domain-containing protein [Spirosoma taeanense]
MRARFGFFFLWMTALGLSQSVLAQQQCADRLTFTPVSQPNQIEWSKFPQFTLPFPVVFGGPRLGDANGSPLRHGFSHIVHVQDSEYGTVVPFRQRAVEWSGFATGLSQPWETIESPWANDLNAYRAKWDRFLSDLAGGQKNAAGQYNIQTNRLVLDIERIQETEARILRLKLDTRVPEAYRKLPDGEFVVAYKNAIRNLYAEGLRYVRQHADLTGVSVSSYADTPILNTYLNVPTFPWTDWTTNLSRVNYLVKDSTERAVGGPFYAQLDALSPSAYYYYDYPNPLAQDCLAYLLFQVEANRAWSTKPVVPWVWLRYHDSSGNYPNFIQPFMAEATAIFPFFSGAAGLWLWDDQSLSRTRTDNHAAYEHFIHGLYRLSRFADMFQAPYELVIETPARDLMDKQLPVWRGVVKNNTILIAAQNPYAAEGAKTELVVRYRNWGRTIELTGREVSLCRYEMGTVTATEPVVPEVQVFPNPATTTLTISFARKPTAATELVLLTAAGRVVSRTTVATAKETLNVATLPAGLYFLRITSERGSQTKKIVIK